MMRFLKIEQGLELYEASKEHPSGRSKWLREDGVKAYMRVTKRLIGDEFSLGVTISSVDVAERFQRKGRFKALLELCNDFVIKHDLAFVYVESVLNEDLMNYLLTQGFIARYKDMPVGGDFYRPKVNSQ